MTTNQFEDLSFCSACGVHYNVLKMSRLVLISGQVVYKYICDDCLSTIKPYSKGVDIMPPITGNTDIALKIKQRRLQMLVHSRIYYVLGLNIIEDYVWSRWAVELAALQNMYPEVASTVCFRDAFIEWDGSTGAFLPLDDPWVIYKADYLLKMRNMIY